VCLGSVKHGRASRPWHTKRTREAASGARVGYAAGMTNQAQSSVAQQVLVTGAAGTIGTAAAEALRGRGHHVRGFDSRPMPTPDDSIVADLTDRPSVDRAMAGIDTLIHLAAYPNPANFIDTLLAPNVIGLYHVVSAAVAAGVRRIVLASSMQVVSGYRRQGIAVEASDLITTRVRAPTNDYALTKVWAEDLGEMVARVEGLEVIVGRIGFVPRTPREAQKIVDRPVWRGFYLSHDDAGRFFVRAVEAPWPGEADAVPFHVVYVMGPPPEAGARHDRGPGEALGFFPRDVFPAGLPFEAPGAEGTS